MSDYTNYADEVDSAADVTAEVPAEVAETEEVPVEEAGTEVLEDGTTVIDHVVTAADLENNLGEDLAVGDVVGLVTDPEFDGGADQQ